MRTFHHFWDLGIEKEFQNGKHGDSGKHIEKKLQNGVFHNLKNIVESLAQHLLMEIPSCTVQPGNLEGTIVRLLCI